MGKTRSMREEMDGKLFISRQNRLFSFVKIINKTFIVICALIWRVNNRVSRQEKELYRKNETTRGLLLLLLFVASDNTLLLRLLFVTENRPSSVVVPKIAFKSEKKIIQSSPLTIFPKAALRKRNELATLNKD